MDNGNGWKEVMKVGDKYIVIDYFKEHIGEVFSITAIIPTPIITVVSFDNGSHTFHITSDELNDLNDWCVPVDSDTKLYRNKAL